ncbi:MAG: PHP domain-containing protein [Dehalococcoidia bacterium]|tara:strand:- start:2287 stop:2979 length:693 start_codon:yes stop_codon:yes gene_type:complete
MSLILDMHIHTKKHSSDSMLDPSELLSEIPEMPMSGINICEHDKVWNKHEIEEYKANNPQFFCSFGIEVATDYGHVVALGLTEYISGIHKLEKLKEEIDKIGGFIFIAHPFRYVFDKVTAMRQGATKFEMTPEEASEMEVFKLVHGVEIANGGNTPQENEFAYDVAKYLDLTILGGSDAHSLSGLGYYATRINSQINSQDELISALHTGNTDVMTLNKEEGTYEIYQPPR